MVALTGTTIRVVHPSHCPDIGPICQVRDEPPQQHDQQIWVAEVRALLEHGLTRHFSAELQVPLKLTSTTIQYLRQDGTPFVPDYENIHHRNETLFGLGDPAVSIKTAWKLGRWTLRGQGGSSLPVGRTEVDPFALGRQGKPHQHVQYGTGTFDPFAVAEAEVALGDYRVIAGGRVQLTLAQNALGYQAGSRYSGSLRGEGPLRLGKLRASVGLDAVNEQPERWFGVVEQDGNLGRTDVLVGAGLSYPFDGVTISAQVRIPIWQQLIVSGNHDGGQLSFPAIVGFTVQRTFDPIR
jgi:hypothetical protein